MNSLFEDLDGINLPSIFNQEKNILEEEKENSHCYNQSFNNDSKEIFSENTSSANSNENKLINDFGFNIKFPLEEIKFIDKIKKDKKKKEKKKLGKKKKRDDHNNNYVHNKFSDDNLRKKCKHIVLRSAIELLNKKIRIMYNGDIGFGIFKKELQTINQSQKSDATINFNKKFLNKTLGEIYSDDISKRYTSFTRDHNRNIIQNLLNEKDEVKRKYFQKLFGITFFDCLKHFRGDENIEELEGLKCFNEIEHEFLDKNNNEKDYIKHLGYHLKNYEKIIDKKKPRKQDEEKEISIII